MARLAERVAANCDAELVFVGDSITQQWETVGQPAWERHFAPRRALNLGVGWEQTQNVLWRIEQGHLDCLDPRLVVLMIGTNNSEHGGHGPDEIAAGVRAIVDGLRRRGIGRRNLLVGIPPRGRRPGDPLRENNEAANQRIAEIADGRSVYFRDFGEALSRSDGSVDDEIMPDHLHLSSRGYELWAEAMESTIRLLLGEDDASAESPAPTRLTGIAPRGGLDGRPPMTPGAAGMAERAVG